MTPQRVILNVSQTKRFLFQWLFPFGTGWVVRVENLNEELRFDCMKLQILSLAKILANDGTAK